MNISAELILSNLHVLVIGWTALTLCWGIYIQAAFMQMMSYAVKKHGGQRETDSVNLYFMILANVALVAALLVEGVVINFVDVLIVINIFYNTYLFAGSYNVCRWWKSKQHNS